MSVYIHPPFCCSLVRDRLDGLVSLFTWWSVWYRLPQCLRVNGLWNSFFYDINVATLSRVHLCQWNSLIFFLLSFQLKYSLPSVFTFWKASEVSNPARLLLPHHYLLHLFCVLPSLGEVCWHFAWWLLSPSVSCDLENNLLLITDLLNPTQHGALYLRTCLELFFLTRSVDKHVFFLPLCHQVT